MGCKKQGAKNRVIGTQKEKKAAWPLLFLNNNDPDFAPCFLKPIFWTFFQGHKPCFQNKNSGCRLTGRGCNCTIESKTFMESHLYFDAKVYILMTKIVLNCPFIQILKEMKIP